MCAQRLVLARAVLGGILLWCAPSQGAPPGRSPSPGRGVSAPEREGRSDRQAPVLPPNSLVSRSKRVAGWSPARFAAPRPAPPVTPGRPGTPASPRPSSPRGSGAIDSGKGPTRVLLDWSAGGSFNYAETDYGSPGLGYRVETSGDSTDGADGRFEPASKRSPCRPTGGEPPRLHRAALGQARGDRRAPEPERGSDRRDRGPRCLAGATTPGSSWATASPLRLRARACPPPGFAVNVHQRHLWHFPAVVNGGMGATRATRASGTSTSGWRRTPTPASGGW